MKTGNLNPGKLNCELRFIHFLFITLDADNFMLNEIGCI